MAIKVLLRRTIDGVGDVGQVVRVKNGYARNFLFPRGWAAFVTPDALVQVEKDKATEAVRLAAEAKQRAALAGRLAQTTVTVEARAGQDGHLYGSVGARQVAHALAREGYPILERQVRLEPVRELGEYEVPIHLGRDQVVQVRVWVVQDAREAAAEAADAAEAAAARAAETAPQGQGGPAAP
jgi:large subunit ribosomal protein L9